LAGWGLTGGQARVFSAFIKDVDKRPDPTVWGTRLPFNTVCAEFPSPAGGWVHSVAFSPSGDSLAYCSHDSCVTVVYPAGPEEPARAVLSVRTPMLPFVSLLWVGEEEIVAAGHDCQPILFKGNESGWSGPLIGLWFLWMGLTFGFRKMVKSLDDSAKSSTSRDSEHSAFHMFRNMDRKGSSKAATEDTTLPTVHQNTIT
jgi:actin related protein 2/3 complex, subunit 1A/1B